MYSVIIIDDEPIVCDGLKRHIPWGKYGFTVEKAFTSSSDALNYLKENDVDMVLTDIEMPIVSGIDIAKYAFEFKPNTIVCFISGHQNFDYAKSALKYGVADYIVKPTEVGMAEECLDSVKRKLDERGTGAAKSTDDEVYELARNQLISDVFAGFSSCESEIDAKIKMLKKVGHNEQIYISFWLVFDIERNKKENSITTLLDELYETSDIFKFQALIIKSNEAFIIATCSKFAAPEECKKKFAELLTDFKTNVQEKYSIESEYNINKVFGTLDELLEYLVRPFILSDDEITKHVTLGVLNEKFKTVFLAVSIGDKVKLDKCYENIKVMLSRLSLNNLKKVFINFFEIFFEKLPNTTRVNFSWLEVQSIREISESQTCEEVFQKTIKILHNMIMQIESFEKGGNMNFFVKKACMYVESNYMKNITVEYMANYLYLNASYFSRMFKIHTHENFKKYLSKVRIAKALEFYSSGKYTTAQIAEMVGYKSPKYFRQQFKNVMGKNFSQYLMDLGCKENTENEDY